MAETGIDFGQTSAPKYSLRGFLNKQETAMPIAQDMAQAIQVGGNLAKYAEVEKDKAEQARYFNANIAMTNMKSQQVKELEEAGYDLNKKREIIDRYSQDYNNLSTTYELGDKYKADILSSTSAHTNVLEGAYSAEWNKRKKDEVEANIGTVIANSAGVPKDQMMTILEEMRKYHKENVGTSDRETNQGIAEQIFKGKWSSIDKETLDYAQADLLRKETLDTIKEFDPQSVGSDTWLKQKDSFDKLVEHYRGIEYTNFTNTLSLAKVSPETAFKAIDAKTTAGIVPNKDAQEFLKAKYVEDYTTKQSVAESRIEARENRNRTKGNRELEMVYYEAIKNKTTPEEFSKTIHDTAKTMGVDSRMADHYDTLFSKPYETAIATKEKANAENLINAFKSKPETNVPYKDLVNAVDVVASHNNGVYSVENLKLIDDARVRDIYNASPNEVINTPISKVDESNRDIVQKTSNRYIEQLTVDAFNGDGKSLGAISTIIKNHNTVGELPTTIGKSLKNADLETADGVNKLSSDLKAISFILEQNPLQEKALLGDNASLFYMYKAASISTPKGQDVGISQSEVLKIQEIKSNPHSFDKLISNYERELATFGGKWQGSSLNYRAQDLSTYKAMRMMGVDADKALEELNKQYTVLKGKNYSLVGVDTTNPQFSGIEKAMSKLSEQSKLYGDKTYFSVDPDTQSIVVGTKEFPRIQSLNIPLATTTDANGKKKLGIVELMSYISITEEENKVRNGTFLGSKQGQQNLNKVYEKLNYIASEFPADLSRYTIKGFKDYGNSILSVNNKASLVLQEGIKSNLKTGVTIAKEVSEPFIKAVQDLNKMLGIETSAEGLKKRMNNEY